MKLFVLYILSSFLLGVLLWKSPAGARTKVLVLMSLFVCIGYYFLNQV